MTSFEQLESDMRSGCPQDVLRCDIANALLDANTTDQEIQQIFSFYGTRRFIDFPLFCQCVEAYIEQQRISRLLTPLSNYAQILTNKMTAEMQQYTLDLLIDDNPYKRIMGRHFWDKFGVSRFDFQLLSCLEDVQIRFVVSILQDVQSPQTRLPIAFSLFDSPCAEVRIALVASATLYLMNYISTTKQIFVQQQYCESEEQHVFQTLIESQEHWIQVHQDCKELDSNYLYSTLYDLARREISRHLKEGLAMAKKNAPSTFLDFVSNIQLGRGGGIRGENGSVQPLSEFSCTIEVPMMLLSQTPLEEQYFNKHILADWSETRFNNEK